MQTHLITATIIAALTLGANAQVLYSSGTYTQDFNSLPSAPALNAAWTDDSTLAEWYGSRTSIDIDDGGDNSGDLKSYGVDNNSDRSLGSLGSSTANPVLFGLQLQNTSSAAFTSFSLTYDREIWRTAANSNSWTFSYLITGSSGNQLSVAGFTDIAGLGFTVAGVGSSSGQDGNANSLSISGSVTGISWGANEYLWIRWSDPDDSGTDGGVGIDNMSFTAVPEPSTFALAALGLAGVVLIRRRKI